MTQEPRPPLTFGTRLRIATSGLFVALGIVIIARAAMMGLTSPNVYLMGAAFIGLGAYRLWWIRHALGDTRGGREDDSTNER